MNCAYIFLDVEGGNAHAPDTDRHTPSFAAVDVMRSPDIHAPPLSVQVATGCACFMPLARTVQTNLGPWPTEDDLDDPEDQAPPTSRPSDLADMGIGIDDEITTDGSYE